MATTIKRYLRIGDNLKFIRENLGDSQTQFAQRIGISRSTYSNYENNNRVPNDETLHKIAAALEVSIYDLLGTKPDNETSIPAPSKVMVRNEKFIDKSHDLSIPYEIKLYREEKPAILNNDNGSFFIEIKIITHIKERKFKLECRYMPASDTRVHAVSVSLYILFVEGEDQADPSNYYDEYAKQIHPDLYEHLRTAIENSIKVYFMEIMRKPLSVDVYHNF